MTFCIPFAFLFYVPVLLAYDQLLTAASGLRRDFLWHKLCHICNPKQEEVEELLCLTTSKPLLGSHLNNNNSNNNNTADREQISIVLESVRNWKTCCDAMSKQPSFSPSHKFQHGQQIAYLFYLHDEDMFLLIRVHTGGNHQEGGGVQLGRLDLIEKQEEIGDSSSEESERKVCQSLTNYLLHYLWFSL